MPEVKAVAEPEKLTESIKEPEKDQDEVAFTTNCKLRTKQG